MRLNTILPPEATARVSRIVLTDMQHLLIEQHKGLFSYDESCIRVRLSSQLLSVLGADLVIRQFSAEDICIQGEIRALEFSR